MPAGSFFRLADLEPLECPIDLGLPPEPQLEVVIDAGWEAMERRLELLDHAEQRGDDLRQTLLGWCTDLAASARLSHCDAIVARRLSVGDPIRQGSMLAWMEGRWSSRSSLLELCWRLEQDPVVATAALLLFDHGGGTEEQRPYLR
jgi:hypothetical protein